MILLLGNSDDVLMAAVGRLTAGPATPDGRNGLSALHLGHTGTLGFITLKPAPPAS